MRVALDATPLAVSTGGVTRYTAELSRALAARFPQDDYWLVSDQEFALPSGAPPNLKRGAGPRSMAERRWWLWGLERELSRLRIEVFHGTDYSVPYLRRRPSVMTLHDLSPWLDPSWQPDADRIRRRTPILLRLGLATTVVTPSDAVRLATIERFHVAPERVVTVPLAASSLFRPVHPAPRENPYFLFVGTLEPRKNFERMVAAWRQVRRRHAVDLLIAGRRRRDAAEIAAEDGLLLLGPVPDEDLPALYSGAAAVLYPSLYEGFGLPVLEAMQCGAVVIASQDPALVEVAGDAAIHVDAVDTGALAQAMQSLMEPDCKFAARSSAALARAAQYSWTRTAERMHEVYQDARRRFRD